MRAFYKQILQDFHIYCGNRSQMRDWTDDELKKLLDVLCKVSEVYSYIPEADQQRIIEAQLVRDMDYTTLNARTVSRWLELNGKSYFKEVAHLPTKEHEPATEEQKEFWINEWKKELSKVVENFTVPVKGGGQRLRENMKDLPTEPPKPEELPQDKNAVKSFMVEGVEVFANTQEEADNIFHGRVGH
jgi:hypothetical protein